MASFKSNLFHPFAPPPPPLLLLLLHPLLDPLLFLLLPFPVLFLSLFYLTKHCTKSTGERPWKRLIFEPEGVEPIIDTNISLHVSALGYPRFCESRYFQTNHILLMSQNSIFRGCRTDFPVNILCHSPQKGIRSTRIL